MHLIPRKYTLTVMKSLVFLVVAAQKSSSLARKGMNYGRNGERQQGVEEREFLH